MAIKLFGSSITSAYKSVVSTVSKTVSKVTGSSGSKSSSTNSKSSSTGNKTSSSVSSKSSSSGNKASSGTSSKVSSTANKTSATVSSKTVSSNVSKVSSTSKQSTSTKYVTNAAAIYNSSGAKVSGTSSVSTGRPARSYATQAKATAASNQKTSSNKTLIGSPNRTTNGAISTGRPKQSYISQPKTSTAKGKTTAQTKLPVPVAQKAPLVTKTSTPKKDPSEASYSNNRPQKSYTHVVAYTPTASREGAGQMFYMSRTNPTGAKEGASFGLSLIPYAGDAKDIQEAVTGKDLITGKKLTGGDRALTITAAVLPVVSGPMLKGAAKGGKIAVKEAPGAIKKAGTLIKKNAPEVKKAVKNSDVAKDTAKVLKDKAIKVIKGAAKKTDTKIEKAINEYVKGRKSFNDVIDDYAKIYADKVNANVDWSWNKSIAGGENLSIKQKKMIKQKAIDSGLIKEIKVVKTDGMKYGVADFESAGVVKETVYLPENMWKMSDAKQFSWLDKQIGSSVEGYTWHHTEVPGKMQLVPKGTHNITNHNGGRTKGMWADAPR